MYRVKSNALWHSLPGVVAAYQSIAAPDPFAARQNVAHNGALVGVYTAALGVAPPWGAANGWTFNGTNQYLTTGVIPVSSSALIVRIANQVTDANNRSVIAEFEQASSTAGFGFTQGSGTQFVRYGNDGTTATLGITAGVLSQNANSIYVNGVLKATSAGTWTGNAVAFFVGARNLAGSADRFWSGTVLSALVVSRTLSPAEVWLASRQMAYCEANPDWNAWARRRRYYYAPPAAATTFQPAWARNANSVLQVTQ